MHEPGTRPLLAVSVAREIRRRFMAAAVTAALIFSAALALGLRTIEHSRTWGAAQAAFTSLAASRDLTAEQALAKLCVHRPDVVAAGLTGPDGRLRAQWPADAALGDVGVAVGRNQLARIRFEDSSATARCYWHAHPADRGYFVIWLRPGRWWDVWLASSLAAATFIGLVQRVQAGRLSTWIEGRIMLPLQHMASPHATAGLDAGPILPAARPCDELTAVGDRLDALRQEVEKSQRRIRFLERRGQDQLRASQRQYERRLQRTRAEALIDPLTRLYNRRFLKEELDGIFQHQREAREELAIVMIDLDNFKGLNDTRGHQAGDTMLRFAADLIRGSIRKSDYAVRYGGDEFVLVMPGTDRAQAGAVVKRIVSLFAQYARRDGDDCAVSMSAGIATMTTERAVNGSELMCKADAALYRAKGSGKNTVVLSPGCAVA